MVKAIDSELAIRVNPKAASPGESKDESAVPKLEESVLETEPVECESFHAKALEVLGGYLASFLPDETPCELKTTARHLYPYVDITPGPKENDLKISLRPVSKEDGIKLISEIVGINKDEILKSRAFKKIIEKWDEKSSLQNIPQINDIVQALNKKPYYNTSDVNTRYVRTETIIMGVPPEFRAVLAQACDNSGIKHIHDFRDRGDSVGEVYQKVGFKTGKLLVACKEHDIDTPLKFVNAFFDNLKNYFKAYGKKGIFDASLSSNNLEIILEDSSNPQELVDVVKNTMLKLNDEGTKEAIALFGPAGGLEEVEAFENLLISLYSKTGVFIHDFEYSVYENSFKTELFQELGFSSVPKIAGIKALEVLAGQDLRGYIESTDIYKQWDGAKTMQLFPEFGKITSEYSTKPFSEINIWHLIVASKDGKPLLSAGVENSCGTAKLDSTFLSSEGDKPLIEKKFEESKNNLKYIKELDGFTMSLCALTKAALKYDLEINPDYIPEAKDSLKIRHYKHKH